jgi:hypothetical protein
MVTGGWMDSLATQAFAYLAVPRQYGPPLTVSGPTGARVAGRNRASSDSDEAFSVT